MKKFFMCSLICHNGVIGGGLYIEDDAITYKTNKLTVDRKYRNLVLKINDIRDISWKWIVLPVVTLQMANGEQYKFIIFGKKRFEKYYSEVKHI